MRPKALLVSLVTTVIFATTAEAATVRGTVRDRSGSPGSPVANVPVLLWQHGGGWMRTVSTGWDGYFEGEVPDGATYNVACNKPDQAGYRTDLATVQTENVAVGSDDVVVNFDLATLSAPSSAPSAPSSAPSTPSSAPSAPSSAPPGVGVDTAGGTRAPVTAAYAAHGQAAVGGPYDNGGSDRVHGWGGGWIQDFRGGSDGTGALMYRDGEASAHWVHGDAWTAYLAAGGGPGRLGFPTADAANGRQTFEHGALVLANGAWVVEAKGRVGVDGNQIFTDDGNLALDADAVAATGARVLRVNFRRGGWGGPRDGSVVRGRTWLAAADEVVNALAARGISVYGLLNDELRSSNDFLRDMRDPAAAQAWIEEFAADCEAVVERLRDRVHTFEVINEPNDWAGGSSARVSPYWEALILRRVYERVKLAHPAWPVTLVSGPLFTFVFADGADYLGQVYDEGTRAHGWDDVRARCGSYPLDGIGVHLYHAQDASDAPSAVAPAFSRELDRLAGVVGSRDPEAAAKRFYVSELGWQSSVGGEAHQADMLEAGFDALLGDDRVALAVYFCLSDWPGASWGLRDRGHGKLALDRFRAIATRSFNPPSEPRRS